MKNIQSFNHSLKSRRNLWKGSTLISGKDACEHFKKKRIGVVFLSSSSKGGGAKSLYLFLKNTNFKRGSFVIIFTSHGNLVEKIKNLGYKTKVINKGKQNEPLAYYILRPWLVILRLYFKLSYIVRLIFFIRKEKLGALYVNTIRNISAGISGKICRIKVIYHLRGLDKHLRGIRKLRLLGLSKLADEVISVCEGDKNSLIKLCPNSVLFKHIKVVPNGIDLKGIIIDSQKVNRLREKYKISSDSVVIGNVARIEPEKGVSEFVEAANVLHKKSRNVKFIWVGGISFNKCANFYFLQIRGKCNKYDLKENVFFLGEISDVFNYISLMDIFVFPSHYEGFPRAILEAMVIGKPVIATDVGGIGEIVIDNKTGFLVPKGDINKLTRAISILIKNVSLREKMGQRGRQRVQKYFTIEKNCRGIEKVLKGDL